MHDVKITDDYRNLISKSPNILAIRFINSQPVEVISKDPRYGLDVDQVVLTRKEVLGDFEERIKAGLDGK